MLSENMKINKEKRIKKIINKIPSLTNGQLVWLDKVINAFEGEYSFIICKSDIMNQEILNNFGDALRIHHSFSIEPFSKDKFEYVLEQTLKMNSIVASLAPKGNRGHDITINGETFSLKTQADKKIKEDKIWISKFMELGTGDWGNNPKDLEKIGYSPLEIAKLEYEKGLIPIAIKRPTSENKEKQ